MTLEQYLYIKLFTESYNTYGMEILRKHKYIKDVDKFKNKIRLILACIRLEIIVYYYSDLISGDTNIITVAEIKEIINQFNSITGSSICYQEF